MKPPNVPHKQCSRQAENWTSVSPWYEDMIANDVANPNNISTTFDTIGGLGEMKRALHEIVMLPLLRPELFLKGNLLTPAKGVMLYGRALHCSLVVCRYTLASSPSASSVS